MTSGPRRDYPMSTYDGQAVYPEIDASQPFWEPRFPITIVQAVAVEGSRLSSALRPCRSFGASILRFRSGPDIIKFRSGTLDRTLAMDGTPEQYKLLED